jgi:hypothetical protein
LRRQAVADFYTLGLGDDGALDGSAGGPYPDADTAMRYALDNHIIVVHLPHLTAGEAVAVQVATQRAADEMDLSPAITTLLLGVIDRLTS